MLIRTRFPVARTFLSVRFTISNAVRGQECPRHQVHIGKAGTRDGMNGNDRENKEMRS